MASSETQSGKVIGRQYLERVAAYLQATPALPLLPDGSLNVTAIAAGANVPRQSLYKNPGIRTLLETARANRATEVQVPREITPASSPTTAAPEAQLVGGEKVNQRRLEQRIHQLEQQNAALVAENAELRRQLKAQRLQMGREDMTIETGRRFPAPTPEHG